MQHWPGDPSPELDRAYDMDRGDSCNMREIHMSAHTGTHIDAPLHYFRDGASMDEMPPDATLGPARVVAVPGESINAHALQQFRPQAGERILFRTANSATHWCGNCFRKHFVHVTPDGARHMVECGVRTVGVDYLSVGAYGPEGDETHRILLGAGIWVIEGLDLEDVEPGLYELLCLPLRIGNGDGAPARALLRALP
jgi:arylformamidase